MMKNKTTGAILFLLFSLPIFLSGCLPTMSTQTAEPINQATRSAAATAQAEVNLLQNQAFVLEEELDAHFSDYYVGMQVESYPTVKVIIYLTAADKEQLAPLVTDPKLLEVIEVRHENISRKALRELRERFKGEMDMAGVIYTTGIKMEPARLQVYVLDIPEAESKLKAAHIAIPEHVEFVQMESLPEGG